MIEMQETAVFSKRVQTWCQGHSVRLCVLFGSQATGETHEHSDVDLAIWPSEPIEPLQKLDWWTELTAALDEDVSLVLVSPDLDPTLGFEIVRNGRVLFEAEPGLWVRERARLWHAWNDSFPFRRALHRQLRQFAQEVLDGF
ncbi:MAG: nucleotidyltransferase domain-containing protein [Anaerolineae bacterium]